jgi:hypothetical protein
MTPIIWSQNPGNITNLRVWARADAGTSTTINGAVVTTWASQAPGIVITGALNTTNTGVGRPTYVSIGKNFHPAVSQSALIAGGFKFIGALSGTTVNSDFSAFTVGTEKVRATFQSWLLFTGPGSAAGGWAGGTTGTTDNPFFYTNGSGQSSIFSSTIFGGGYAGASPSTVTSTLDKPFIGGLVFKGASNTLVDNRYMVINGFHNQLDGSYNTVAGTTSRDLIVMGDGNPDTSGALRETQEFIVFDKKLTNSETAILSSYLAIKYGITKVQSGSAAVDDIVLSDGTTEVWDKDLNATYNSHIFGIGKEANNGNLDQKVSQSEDPDATFAHRMIAATTKNFTAANADGARTSLGEGNFYMFGDNDAAAGQAALSITCPALSDGMLKLNKQWLVQTTGVPGSIWLEIDMAGSTINSEVTLVVADDAALSTNAYTVVGEFVGGKAVFNISFTGDKYFSVVGKTVAGPCTTCVGGTFSVNSGLEWNPLADRAANDTGVFSVGTDADGNTITARNQIVYSTPANEYLPNWYPSTYGAGSVMGRYDTTNGAAGNVTYTTTLSHASAVDFQINGISSWYGNKVKVVVTGSCNGVSFTPKLSPVITGSFGAWNAYTITGNTAIGNNSSYQGLSNYGAIKVAFDKPVTTITVVWSIERAPTYITGFWLYISNFTLKCLSPPTPNLDRVYVEQSFDNKTKPACGDAEMKVVIDNTNCAPRDITTFTNNLPAGLEYIPDTFSSSDIAVTPTYSGTNFSLPAFILPSGKSTYYIRVKPTDPLIPTTTYQTQASYTVAAGAGGLGGSYLSDNAEGVAGVQTTPIEFTAAPPLPLPSIALTSNVEPGSCGLITYTATLNNTTGGTLTNYEFNTQMNPGQTMVVSSVVISGVGSGTVQPAAYAGLGNFVVAPMTLPVGVTTITWQMDGAQIDDNPLNEVFISADPSNLCALASRKSASLPDLSCERCIGGTFSVKSGNAWYPLGARSGNTTATYAVGTDSQGTPITANNTITYATPSNEYVPTWYPSTYGAGTVMGRWDNTNGSPGLATYTTTLSHASEIDFQINGISTWYGNKVKVVIKGECDGKMFTPKITPVVTGPFAAYNSYTISGNTVTGDKYYHGLNNFGAVKVSFEKPVNKVIIEWTIERSPTYITGYWLIISDFALKCVAPLEPNPDNVHVQQMFMNKERPACSDAEMKVTVINNNCTPKDISTFTNTLPAGIEYIAGTYSSSDISATPIYSGQNFTLPTFTAPPGRSVYYVKVKSTNPASPTTTYQTQASFAVVAGAGGPYLSDNAEGTPGIQTTPVTFNVSPTVPVPDITLTSDIEPGSCGIVTYTATINNNTGSTLTDYEFTTQMNPGQTMVASSVAITGVGSGTVQPAAYAGQGNFVVAPMSLPVGVTTITWQMDGAQNVEKPLNEVFISARADNECALATRKSASLPQAACVSCVGGNQVLNSWAAWNTGNKAANTVTNYALSGAAPSSGALTADISVVYPNTSTEWLPTLFPRWWGKFAQLSRYDNLTGAASLVTYTVDLKSGGVAVAGVPSFQIGGITKVGPHATKVKVIGYCGADVVEPKVTSANGFLPATFNRQITAANTATGTKPYYDIWTMGTINVQFEKAVEKVVIEWTMDRGSSTAKGLSSIFVGDMKFTCDNPLEPNADLVHLIASYIEPALPTCEEATMKINIKNLNCTAKTIDITNTLPASLEYVANSYVPIAAETPTYNGQSFSLTGLSVPAGNSYIYVRVKPTNTANSDTYATDYKYTVAGGTNIPNPYESDDDSGATGFQDTSITYTGGAVPSKPTIVKTVDKCLKLTNTLLTYTIAVNNTTGTGITGAEFLENLNENQTFVAGSLVNPFGGTANAYGTADNENYLNITGMTIPAGETANITFQVNTNTSSDVYTNAVSFSSDPATSCGSASTVYSNELALTLCTFCTENPNVTEATDFTSVGISTHETMQAGWPDNVPNGFLTLESSKKGFVITRLTTAQRDAATFTPVKGMLIYVTDANGAGNGCFQLYNGTIWSCITRSCND